LVAVVGGTILAFGGAVWWAPVVIASLAWLSVLGILVQCLLQGRLCVVRSPLAVLGVLALGLASFQLVPLPASIAGKISPQSRALYALGTLPRLVQSDDPGFELPELIAVRSPVTVDRSATLRWMAGAAVCLGIFWAVSQFTDRVSRLYLIWGSVVAGFLINTAIGVVQLICGAGGVYGFLEPGRGSHWFPSVNDLVTAPNMAVLRLLPASKAGHPPWAAVWPDKPFQIGSMLGGPDAYLALGSLGLPLLLALVLQLMAPRGSREGLWARLGHSGQGSLLVLLCGLGLTSAVLVGILAGPMLCLPFGLALLLVGLPSTGWTGLRWSAVGVTAAALLAIGLGVGLGKLWAKYPDAGPPVKAQNISEASVIWKDARRIVHDFPIVGSGLGSFASIYPFYKSRDEAATTAQSSLLQWWVEGGVAGLGLLVVGVLWSLKRLPAAIGRVGPADRALAFGLIGAAVGFSLYSLVHWSVELVAVSIAASAIAGTGNRWLAGGTDLFVERV
jgi:hypothetical protein